MWKKRNPASTIQRLFALALVCIAERNEKPLSMQCMESGLD